eukprot:TRINITY_DN34578_c0_g1_i1.p2 TRINITY_DN34578_c0_g1~~TRINITY_DN34578_c0_g1_i1.p2  ORF type:complete len:167 (-),score=12.32 TRINITY_DN34578_c0_g1_i1:442-942(-)
MYPAARGIRVEAGTAMEKHFLNFQTVYRQGEKLTLDRPRSIQLPQARRLQRVRVAHAAARSGHSGRDRGPIGSPGSSAGCLASCCSVKGSMQRTWRRSPQRMARRGWSSASAEHGDHEPLATVEGRHGVFTTMVHSRKRRILDGGGSSSRWWVLDGVGMRGVGALR